MAMSSGGEEGAVVVFENNLGKPGKKLKSSVDLAFNYASLEADDNLYCMNGAGKLIWKYQIPSGINDLKSSLEGKYIAVSSNNGGMFYLDNTGKLLWSYSLGKAIPVCEVSPDGSIVVATTVPPSGKGHTLCILSKAGQVLRHLSTPYEVRNVGVSFDGNVIITGDANHNVAQYTKSGDRQWIYSIHAPIQEMKISQSGLLIFARTTEIISISPSGTERWRIRIPEGPISGVKMSHDGSVSIACGSGTVFRYDLKGKFLWKHPMPGNRKGFQMSYRSYNLVFLTSQALEYWDKYGYAISSFPLPAAEQISDDCISLSQDGRYVLYLDNTGMLKEMDVGKVLAKHLIVASKIFMDELKRLGTITPGAEENLQWAMESMADGDVQNALIFGSQAYSGMEATLDSLPTRKSEKPTIAPAAVSPSLAVPGVDYIALYKKGLKEIFSVKDEPSEIEWSLLTILRDAFKITVEQHNTYEEETRASLKSAAPAAPSLPPVTSAPTLSIPDTVLAPEPKFEPRIEPAIEPVVAPSFSIPDTKPYVEPRAEPVVAPTLTIPDITPSVEPAPLPPEFSDVSPAPATPEPPKVDYTPSQPSTPVDTTPSPPTATATPAEDKPAQTNFSMDSYVSDILGKYLKK